MEFFGDPLLYLNAFRNDASFSSECKEVLRLALHSQKEPPLFPEWSRGGSFYPGTIGLF